MGLAVGGQSCKQDIRIDGAAGSCQQKGQRQGLGRHFVVGHCNIDAGDTGKSGSSWHNGAVADALAELRLSEVLRRSCLLPLSPERRR